MKQNKLRISQLQQAEAFIKNHLHLRGEILGLQRTDTFEIPIPAIREAIVNAVLHRDFSNFGRDIKTENDLYQGRSEISNRVS